MDFRASMDFRSSMALAPGDAKGSMMLLESSSFENPWKETEITQAAPEVDTLELFAVRQNMRALVLQDRIDINQVMRQACKNMSERNLGEMDKLRFSIALAKTFSKLKLRRPVIDAVGASFPAGGADDLNVSDNNAGDFEAVNWKQFVNDLHSMMPAARAGPGGTEEVRGLLQAMRRHVEVRQFDLTGTFWSAMRGGSV